MTAPSTAAMAERLVAEGARPDSANLIAGMLLDRLQYGPDGGVPIVVDTHGKPSLTVTGTPVSVADLVQGFRVALPELWASRATASAPAPQTMTAKVAAEDRAQRLQGAAPRPANPWHPSSINVTMQVALEARDPARAAQLKAEAGAR